MTSHSHYLLRAGEPGWVHSDTLVWTTLGGHISIAKLSFFMRENAAFNHLNSTVVDWCRLDRQFACCPPHGPRWPLAWPYCPSVCCVYLLLWHVIICPKEEEEEMLLCCCLDDVSGARWRQAPTVCCRRKVGRRPPWGNAVGMAAAVRCRVAPSAGKGVAAAAVRGVRRISVGGLRAPDTSGRRCVPGRWDSSRRY